jgi:hypothetical protein
LSISALLVGAPVAHADRPVEEGFVDVFDDVNPCTGLVDTVTITGTYYVHTHDGKEVISGGKTTISTSGGFSGTGTITEVDNGQIFRAVFFDRLSNDAGDQVHAKGVIVIDLSSDTVRVQAGGLTCVG